jgi:hypothetical protein
MELLEHRRVANSARGFHEASFVSSYSASQHFSIPTFAGASLGWPTASEAAMLTSGGRKAEAYCHANQK